jgi:cytochrome c551/c552
VIAQAPPVTSGVKKTTVATPVKQVAQVLAKVDKVPTYNDVKGMLASYTCLSCHNPDRKIVGPAFKDIAKRKYSPEKIVQLIHNPQPENWPEYPTPMPPMPQVKKEDGLKIAAYINSLR